jgi:hypothetical protein
MTQVAYRKKATIRQTALRLGEMVAQKMALMQNSVQSSVQKLVQSFVQKAGVR